MNLQSYFTIRTKGIKYVTTIEDRKYSYRLYYTIWYMSLLVIILIMVIGYKLLKQGV